MYLIEVLGTPKSGKSKIIKELYSNLQEKGKRVALISAGFRDCPFKDIDDQVFDQQIWSTFSLINKFLEVKNSEKKFDFIFFDRGFWDRRVMIEYFRKKRKISSYEYRYLKLILDRFLDKINLVVYILTDPEISVNRNLEREGKVRFNEDELKEINMIHEELMPANSIILNGNKSLSEVLQSLKSNSRKFLNI